MTGTHQPLNPRIGPITLDAPFCQAGLAGYSDRAMRVVARRRGCPYAVTEALLDTVLLQGGKGLANSIDINDQDHPCAGQVIGSDPDTVAPAARILHQAGYDVIDLNFACPVKKIKNKARGGHMLRDVPRGLAILRAVRDALPHATLTVSLRRAFDDQPDSQHNLFLLCNEIWKLNYAAVRVHARTVEQKYAGHADWNIFHQLRNHYPNRTLIGSGDIFSAADAVRMLRTTPVDIVWIARGAIGNPWIFSQARALLSTNLTSPTDHDLHALIHPPTLHQQRDALAEHFDIAMHIHGESLAGRRMRKMGIKYARFHPNAPDVKQAFINVRSLREWTSVLEQHYHTNAPGVWPPHNAPDEVNSSCEDNITPADNNITPN